MFGNVHFSFHLFIVIPYYEFEKWRSLMELQNETDDVVLRKYLGDDGQILRSKFLERGSVLMEFLKHRNRFLDDVL